MLRVMTDQICFLHQVGRLWVDADVCERRAAIVHPRIGNRVQSNRSHSTHQGQEISSKSFCKAFNSQENLPPNCHPHLRDWVNWGFPENISYHGLCQWKGWYKLCPVSLMKFWCETPILNWNNIHDLQKNSTYLNKICDQDWKPKALTACHIVTSIIKWSMIQ